MKTRQFYYTDCEKSILTVEPNMFAFGPEPILWCIKGLYGLIPAAMVANALQFLNENTFGKPTVRFHWSQITKIPQEIGDQLTNKQFDYKTDSDES